MVVSCKKGMHRSVAMVERTAGNVERWDGVDVQVEHLKADVEHGMKRVERARAGSHRRG